MNNRLIDTLPEIVEKSGTLFGVIALIVLVIAFLSYVFYIKAEKAERNKAFILVLLFFFGVVLVVLAAGILSGFQRGREAVTAQVEENPLLITLLPATNEKLETFISSDGIAVTEESKAQVLEEALEAYIDPELPPPTTFSPEPTIAPTLTEAPTSTPISTSVPAQTENIEGFKFDLQSCTRSSDTIIRCSFLVTNKEARRELRLSQNLSTASTKIVDLNGEQYYADSIKFGGLESSSYPNYVNIDLAKNVAVKAEAIFKEVPSEVERLQLVEPSFSTSSTSWFPVSFLDIPISR